MPDFMHADPDVIVLAHLLFFEKNPAGDAGET